MSKSKERQLECVPFFMLRNPRTPIHQGIAFYLSFRAFRDSIIGSNPPPQPGTESAEVRKWWFRLFIFTFPISCISLREIGEMLGERKKKRARWNKKKAHHSVKVAPFFCTANTSRLADRKLLRLQLLLSNGAWSKMAARNLNLTEN